MSQLHLLIMVLAGAWCGFCIGVLIGWYTAGWRPFHRRNIAGIEFDGGQPTITNCKFKNNDSGDARAQDLGS